MNLEENTYLQDILKQPQALQAALSHFDPHPLRSLVKSLQDGSIDRIVLTGMGASLYAAYPVWLQLVKAGLPAYWLNTAELVHFARTLITRKTLVWIFSQSGRSAEVVILLDQLKDIQAVLLATVNDLSSPLAVSAGEYILPIWAANERTVSTYSYLNTLAVAQLAAQALVGEDVQAGWDNLSATANAIAVYLDDWRTQLQAIRDRVRLTRHMVLLGRGPSLASANTGMLILNEASKVGAFGLEAGQFRHGPIELAGPELTALLFAGTAETRELMRRLHDELLGHDAHSLWIAPSGTDQPEPQIQMPSANGIGLPLAEIIPVQLLTVHMALENGVEPGKFFHMGKVVLHE